MTTAAPNQPGTKRKIRSVTKPISKKAMLIGMLNRKSGTDVATISAKLGWQSHTTRAALSGLRKAGYEIAAEQPGDGRPTRYRIVAAPADLAAPDDSIVANPHESADAG